MTQAKTVSATVVGMKYHPGAFVVLDMLPTTSPCIAVRDPQNKYDANAIAIKVSTAYLDVAKIRAHTGQDVPEQFLIGHISRDAAKKLAPEIDKAPVFKATLIVRKSPVVEFEWVDEAAASGAAL